MRKIFKALSMLMLVLCGVIFGFIISGDNKIPDEFYITEDQSLNFGKAFTLEAVGEEKVGQSVGIENKSGNSLEYNMDVKVFNIFPIKKSKVTVTQRKYVVPGGTPLGIRLYTAGVVVVGMDEVITSSGSVNPAEASGLQKGDIITAIGGKTVSNNNDVSAAFEKSNGKPVALSVQRDGKELSIIFTTALSVAEGKYRAGIWVRDSSAGIGTMTFYDRDTGVFGGLGHAVCDVDTGEILPLSGGDAVEASIKGCYKGTNGNPGELCGVFGSKTLGNLLINGDTGIYGVLNPVKKNEKQIPVALRNEIKLGAAQIISTVNDKKPQYYDIEITKIYSNSDSHSKNMIIKVTDEKLIKETGGIVQGMSGSPIIQNNMLVGAVTHVFINNPLQGYAIFAETMINTADYAQQSLKKQAS